MSSTKPDPTIILDTGRFDGLWAVAFHPDGKHVFAGNSFGIQRWQLEDGQEAGKQTGMDLNAISVSRDHKWVVCGTEEGASVWNAEIQEKVTEVEGGKLVYAVDVSPDSTSFATGTTEEANIWNITNGKRLVGPLRHSEGIRGVKFSPNGEQIATSCSRGSIRVFDSHNGDELITITTTITISGYPSTPLAWSNDGKQIFAVSEGKKIKSFNVSTGSQLAESPILDGRNVKSIALASNGTFIATYALTSVSFLDTTTLSRIGPIIEDSNDIYSIALTLDSGYLASARGDGKIAVHDLGSILPDVYGPFHASTEQPSTSGGHENKPLESTSEEPGKSSPVKSETRSNDGDTDLLEIEVPSNVPAPQFDYDDASSPVSSVDSCEDEVPPVAAPPAVLQTSDTPPVTSPTEARLEGHHNTVESSQGLRRFKRWLQTNIRRSRKDPGLHKPDGRSGNSRRPAAADQSPSQIPARVGVTNEGISQMAANRREPRAVAKPVVKQQPKSAAKAARPRHRNKNASHSGKRPAGSTEAGPAQQVDDASRPSVDGVHLMHNRGSGRATLKLSITFPAWMLYLRSGTEDGIH